MTSSARAEVAAVVPGAGTLHTDTPEQFAGALDALAGGWTVPQTPSPRHRW